MTPHKPSSITLSLLSVVTPNGLFFLRRDIFRPSLLYGGFPHTKPKNFLLDELEVFFLRNVGCRLNAVAATESRLFYQILSNSMILLLLFVACGTRSPSTTFGYE